MGTKVVRTDLPWMSGTQEDRRARLEAHFRSIGDKLAVTHSYAKQDSILANLCGNCRPIFEELEKGRTIIQICEDWGVTHETVYAYLLTYAPQEWAAMSSGKSLAKMMRAEDELEKAEDNVGVTKWGTMIRSTQWQLERMAPRIYGQKQTGEGLVINVVIDKSCGGNVVSEQ